MNYWLIKSEPFKYSWDQFVNDKETFWDGVRSYSARIFLKEMKVGDHAFFYHSNEGLAIVGIAEVVREHYQDPTTTEDWVAVNVKPVRALRQVVTLKQMKAVTALSEMKLIKIGRLSVSPVTKQEWKVILALEKESKH